MSTINKSDKRNGIVGVSKKKKRKIEEWDIFVVA
jgi:hypothetical protein